MNIQIDNRTLVLLLVAIVCLLYYLYRNGSKSESFVNPKLYEPEMNKVIDESPIMGLPDKFQYPWAENKLNYGETDLLDDGMKGNGGIDFNMCSKSCCGSQYPPPFGLPADPLVCKSKQKFVPSSYSCNDGWHDSGCLCLTEEQGMLLNRRGNNA